MKLTIDLKNEANNKLLAMFGMAYRSRWVTEKEKAHNINSKVRFDMRYRTRKEIFASPKRG